MRFCGAGFRKHDAVMRVVSAFLRAPQLSGAVGPRVLMPAMPHDAMSSWLVAALPDDAVAGSADTTPYVAVYVALVAALFGGIGYLIYQDLEAGKRKREAVQSRAEMADKLRSQGMVREAAILDMEREQLEEQIESARAKPVWEEVSKAAKSRSDRMMESAQAASSTNREDRRVAERQAARQKRKEAKAKQAPAAAAAAAPKPPPSA